MGTKAKTIARKIGARIMKRFLLLSLLLITIPCFAAEDYYQFSSPKEHQRFANLTSELRCLVCQNQNLSESNAALAADLRNQVYQQIQKGQSDKQIVDYLIARYGDFILYRPPVKASTAGLWFGPFIFLFIGLGYLFFYIRNRQKQ